MLFITATVPGSKPISNHYVESNDPFITLSSHLWLGRQLLMVYFLNISLIFLHHPFFFATIVPSQSSLRLIGQLLGWDSSSCNWTIAQNPSNHFSTYRRQESDISTLTSKELGSIPLPLVPALIRNSRNTIIPS